MIKNNLLEALSLDDVRDYAVQFASYVKSVYPDNYQELQHLQKFTDENYNQLLVIAGEFSKLFVSRKN